MDWKLIFCMGLAAAGLLFGLSQWLRARRQLERMDRMLDRAIDGSFLESSFDESVPSALESKMSRFLNGSASSAQEETLSASVKFRPLRWSVVRPAWFA